MYLSSLSVSRCQIGTIRGVPLPYRLPPSLPPSLPSLPPFFKICVCLPTFYLTGTTLYPARHRSVHQVCTCIFWLFHVTYQACRVSELAISSIWEWKYKTMVCTPHHHSPILPRFSHFSLRFSIILCCSSSFSCFAQGVYNDLHRWGHGACLSLLVHSLMVMWLVRFKALVKRYELVQKEMKIQNQNKTNLDMQVSHHILQISKKW